MAGEIKIRFRQPGDVGGKPSAGERRREREAQAEQDLLERLIADGPPVVGQRGRPPRTVPPKIARLALDYLEKNYSVRSVARKFGWGKDWLGDAIKTGKLHKFAEPEELAGELTEKAAKNPAEKQDAMEYE